MVSVPGFFLLALAGFAGRTRAGLDLEYVTVLYRHGDRSAVDAYPTDPYQESAWPQGFGQLSQVGMMQQYDLGRFLRKRYGGFLNQTYIRNEILVHSTDYDRTLMSAESNLAGLYPPSGQQVFNPNLKWQPIPVHSIPKDLEKILSYPMADCPRFQQLFNETKQTEEFKNITKEYQDVVELVRRNTGLNDSTVDSVWGVYDTLFCESRHNMTLPNWVTPKVMEDLKFLKDYGFQITFGGYKHLEKSRLQGGTLLGEIVKNLTAISESKAENKLKMMMLSAHDTTVASLQGSLNVFNGLQPPYASCHMIELLKDENGSFFVSMFYRNDSTKDPYPLQIPGCAFACPLEDFFKITKPSIPEDRVMECQLPSHTTDKGVLIILTVSSCLLLLLIVILLSILCYQSKPKRSHRYSHVINQEPGDES
ncbi:lysosomal acid phosphatase [Synchiropus picturatus]